MSSIFSVHNDEGNIREPDDYQPRAQLRKLFAEGKISSNDNTKIGKFSKKYIVNESLINSYLEHLKNIESRKELRAKERHQAKTIQDLKSYEDYDWDGLYESGKLKELKVAELNKYIKHHNLLTTKMYKAEKCRFVEAHIGKLICKKMIQDASKTVASESKDNPEETESDSDESDHSESEDQILNEFWGESYYDSETDESVFTKKELQCEDVPQINRFGRRVGNWKMRFFQG